MDAVFPAEADQVFIFPENREARVFKIMCFWCWKFLAEKAGLSSTGMVEAFSGNFVIFPWLKDWNRLRLRTDLSN